MKANALKVTVIVSVLVILGVVVAKWLMKKTNNTGESDSESVTENSSDIGSSTYQNTGFPLRRGSKGSEVKHLQSWLNATGNVLGFSRNYDPMIAAHNNLTVDGKFGVLTETSLKQATGMTSVTQAYYITKGMANF